MLAVWPVQLLSSAWHCFFLFSSVNFIYKPPWSNTYIDVLNLKWKETTMSSLTIFLCHIRKLSCVFPRSSELIPTPTIRSQIYIFPAVVAAIYSTSCSLYCFPPPKKKKKQSETFSRILVRLRPCHTERVNASASRRHVALRW